jgi:3-phytase
MGTPRLPGALVVRCTRSDPGRAAGRYSTASGLALVLAVVVVACTVESGDDADAASSAASSGIVTIDAVWQTPRDTLDNIDSPAFWHGPSGQHWLLATAKESDFIVVSDATSGEVIRRVGGEGKEAGRLDRPNGIAVAGDLAFVVERDNARVQVFSLPDFVTVGIYGDGVLRKPYGIATLAAGENTFDTFITDNYEIVQDEIPPDSMLSERVRRFRVTVRDGGLEAHLVRTFGDTSGAGVLRVVESIAADAEAQRLLIAEEQEGASMVKAYTTDGRFTGEIIPSEWFPHQAEGIALYACNAGDGYWIATDQDRVENTFHVFDRASLRHIASFRGRDVLNTDGIALTQEGFGPFRTGAFFAVHDDGSVAAFRWEDVAGALGLRSDCGPAVTSTS